MTVTGRGTQKLQDRHPRTPWLQGTHLCVHGQGRGAAGAGQYKGLQLSNSRCFCIWSVKALSLGNYKTVSESGHTHTHAHIHSPVSPWTHLHSGPDPHRQV